MQWIRIKTKEELVSDGWTFSPDGNRATSPYLGHWNEQGIRHFGTYQFVDVATPNRVCLYSAVIDASMYTIVPDVIRGVPEVGHIVVYVTPRDREVLRAESATCLRIMCDSTLTTSSAATTSTTVTYHDESFDPSVPPGMIRVQLKTEAELLAEGWYVTGRGALNHSYSRSIIPYEGRTYLGGTYNVLLDGNNEVIVGDHTFEPMTYTIIVDNRMEPMPSLPERPRTGNYRIRIKSREELLASGWQRQWDGSFVLTSGRNGYINAQMASYFGFTTDVVLRNGEFVFQGWEWTPEMYVLSEPLTGTPVTKVDRAARRTEARALIEQFRDADPYQARAMVRCGFELETQSTEGLKSDDNDDEFDEDGWDEYVSEQLADAMADLKYAPSSRYADRINAPIDFDDFREWLTEHGIVSLADAVTRGLCNQADADLFESRIEEYIRDNYDREAFYRSVDGMDELLNRCSMPRNVTAGTDGSVSGFEFRTEGARTVTEFMDAAHGIYKLDHEIDEGCSFHIHLSVPGVKHSYGARLQQAMVEYLIDQQTRVPKSVRTRWAYKRSYFEPAVSTDKYSFVHFHSDFKTWEFRCFGNVQNAEDAAACLELAIEALQHGYRVITGKAQLTSDGLGVTNPNDWHEVMTKALIDSTSIVEAYKLIEIELDQAA